LVTLPRASETRRAIFEDRRDAGRRMEVSWHPEEGIVILSFWQEAFCRATFRLPIDDAPALIHELVDALGEVAQGQTPPVAAAERDSVLDRLRRRLRSEVAEIISITDHGRH
jgi:hypothetical protein